MKNLLFWLYVILAIILIGFGYVYWQSKVTSSQPSAKVSQTKTVVFKDKALQKLNSDKKEMKITFVSTPYQVTTDNQSVTQQLKDQYPTLKFDEIMVKSASDTVDIKKITENKPDLVIMDALTLNDFTEKVSSKKHNKQLAQLVRELKKDDIAVQVFGTRPASGQAFKKYQQAEEDYFADSTVYHSQSENWSKDADLKDNYDADSELLTDTGLDNWLKSITDQLFKK